MAANKVRIFFALAIVLIAIASYAAMVIVPGELIRLHYANRSNRELLLELRNRIQIGDSFEDVLNRYWSVARKGELRLRAEYPGCWTVEMPSELLATDWVLYSSFEESGVAGIAVRSYDGPKPMGAPEDIGSQRNCGL